MSVVTEGNKGGRGRTEGRKDRISQFGENCLKFRSVLVERALNFSLFFFLKPIFCADGCSNSML